MLAIWKQIYDSYETRRRWAELSWPLRWSLPRVSPQSGLLLRGYLLHHSYTTPNRLIQHRIRSDGQWPVRSSKAYCSPWISAFVVGSASEWPPGTARQLLAISQPCSSIFTLPSDGPPHRFFDAILARHAQKTLSRRFTSRQITAIPHSPHSLVSSTFSPSSRPVLADLDLSLACLGKTFSPKSRAGW